MMLAAIELERPWALLLLALPITILLWVRLRARPEEDATGTLEIWRRAAEAAPQSAARKRRRVPPAIWALCAALCCASIAIAGPRSSAETESVLVVVDRSPSMYLRDGPSTRLDRALAVARDWLASHDASSVHWIAPPSRPIQPGHDEEIPGVFVAGDPTAGLEIPKAWEQAPRDDRAEPDFSAYDRPGCLWITDHLPPVLPNEAGYVCSGGVAVSGPVGVHDRHFVDWDGQKLVETDRNAPIRSVVAERELPTPIDRAVRAWAKARGFEVGTKAIDDEIALTVSGSASSNEPPSEVILGRDGWRAHVRGVQSAHVRGGQHAVSWTPDDPTFLSFLPLQAWLTDESGTVSWVNYRSGLVSVGFSALDRIEGDSAAFAVSWAKLFDAAVLPPAGCVPLSERLAAGDARPLRIPASATNRAAGRWPAWLAIASCALAVLAAVLSVPVRQEFAGRVAGSRAP